MITFHDDGTTTIDFPSGTITVRPPSYGAFKRLRREREQLVDDLTERVAKLDDLGPIPDDDDQSDEAKAERLRLNPLLRARLRDVEEMTAETLAATWKFILLGDETFDGLATPKPSPNPDDWPTDLLVDAAEIEVVNGQRVRANPTLLDQVFLHFGRARYRS